MSQASRAELRSTAIVLCALSSLSLVTSVAQAYEYAGYRWPTTSMAYQVNIPAEGSNVDRWNDAFEQATNRWRAYSGFDVGVVRGTGANPCLKDGRNGVAFIETLCDGSTFGSQTLAVTVTRFIRAQSRILETDISFNANASWSVYSGDLRSDNDFRRVAVHEIGHGLGFEHEPDEPSILAPRISALEVPQATDIQGIADIYGLVPPPLPDPPGPDPDTIAALLSIIQSIVLDE